MVDKVTDLLQTPCIVCCASLVCAPPPDAAYHYRGTDAHQPTGLCRDVEISTVRDNASQERMFPGEGCDEPYRCPAPEANDCNPTARDALLRCSEIEEARGQSGRLAAAFFGEGCGQRGEQGALAPWKGRFEVRGEPLEAFCALLQVWRWGIWSLGLKGGGLEPRFEGCGWRVESVKSIGGGRRSLATHFLASQACQFDDCSERVRQWNWTASKAE